jgi:hypothetical protein
MQIQRFRAEFEEQLPNLATESEAYPILYMSPIGTDFLTNVDNFRVRFYCFDIIQKDRANLNTILSDTNLILNDLKKWFTEGDNYVYQIIGDPSASPINNALLDYAAGWTMDITFNVDTYCVDEIPFSGNPLVPSSGVEFVYPPYLTCETLEDCPIIIDLVNRPDVFISGGTYDNGILNLTNTTGDTISITGFTTGVSGFDVFVTGGTYNQSTGISTFTNNTGGTFTVAGYFTGGTSAFDVFVTGGTYNSGNILFTNNSGGTFNVGGLFTGNTDVFVTGATKSGSVATFTNNTGGTFTLTGLNDTFVTGGTYSSGTAVFTNNTGGTFNVTGFTTGGTSGVDIFVTGGTFTASAATATFTNNSGGTFNVTGMTTNPFVFKQTNDIAVLSGTSGVQLIRSQLIPANTFANGDIVTIRQRLRRNTGTAGTVSLAIYYNSSNVLAGAISLGVSTAATNQPFNQMKRELFIKSASTEVLSASSNLQTDDLVTTVGVSATAADWTQDQYILFTVQVASLNDSFVHSGFMINRH